jgi:2-amino-4-hydroxy-6-hydroxymethyldihydropteridine diphosphokinase
MHPPPPVTAYIALGSNLGDRRDHLNCALAAVADLPHIATVTPSPFYETAPVGPPDQDRYLNAAAEVRTLAAPAELMADLLDIERRLGRPPRDQRQRWGPRVIDLDLLIYGDTTLDEPGLTLPHPRLHQRDFVLRPVCDLAPDLVHPLLGRTMRKLLAELEVGAV